MIFVRNTRVHNNLYKMKFLSLTFFYKRETRATTFRRKLLIVFLTKFNFVNLINVKLFLYLSIHNLTFIFRIRDVYKKKKKFLIEAYQYLFSIEFSKNFI